MSPEDLIINTLGDEPRIVAAVSAGAGWEVWMQVEFVILCRARGWQVAREIPYPQGNQVLDFLVSANFGERSAIELKVESANNAGRAVLRAFQNDVEKLANFQAELLVDRYALGLGYSDQAKQALAAYADQGDNRTYQAGQTFGVLVESVPLD